MIASVSAVAAAACGGGCTAAGSTTGGRPCTNIAGGRTRAGVATAGHANGRKAVSGGSGPDTGCGAVTAVAIAVRPWSVAATASSFRMLSAIGAVANPAGSAADAFCACVSVSAAAVLVSASAANVSTATLCPSDSVAVVRSSCSMPGGIVSSGGPCAGPKAEGIVRAGLCARSLAGLALARMSPRLSAEAPVSASCASDAAVGAWAPSTDEDAAPSPWLLAASCGTASVITSRVPPASVCSELASDASVLLA